MMDEEEPCSLSMAHDSRGRFKTFPTEIDLECVHQVAEAWSSSHIPLVCSTQFQLQEWPMQKNDNKLVVALSEKGIERKLEKKDKEKEYAGEQDHSNGDAVDEEKEKEEEDSSPENEVLKEEKEKMESPDAGEGKKQLSEDKFIGAVMMKETKSSSQNDENISEDGNNIAVEEEKKEKADAEEHEKEISEDNIDALTVKNKNSSQNEENLSKDCNVDVLQEEKEKAAEDEGSFPEEEGGKGLCTEAFDDAGEEVVSEKERENSLKEPNEKDICEEDMPGAIEDEESWKEKENSLQEPYEKDVCEDDQDWDAVEEANKKTPGEECKKDESYATTDEEIESKMEVEKNLEESEKETSKEKVTGDQPAEVEEKGSDDGSILMDWNLVLENTLRECQLNNLLVDLVGGPSIEEFHQTVERLVKIGNCEQTQVKFRTHVGGTNTSGQQAASTTATSGATDGSSSSTALCPRGPTDVGAGGESGGDGQPPSRGPPSRLLSQCENDAPESGEAKAQKRADRFGDFYCQGDLLPNNLSDDNSDPPDPPDSFSTSPSPAAAASWSRDPQMSGDLHPTQDFCNDLESFQEIVTAAKKKRTLAEQGYIYMRPDLQQVISGTWSDKVMIGEGTYGDVFKVRDVNSGRVLALKLVPIGKFEHAELNGMSIEHQNIIQIYGATVTMEMNPEGDRVLVVGVIEELVPESVTLEQTIQYEWTWTPEDIARILEQILAASVAMHEKGITHHDLHHGNIMITQDMHVYLIDWGQSVQHDQTDLSAQAFQKAAALDVQQAVDCVSLLVQGFVRQHQDSMEWEDEIITLNILREILGRVPSINGSLSNTPSAAELLEDLHKKLSDMQILKEIERGERPAYRIKSVTETDGGSVQDQLEDLVSRGQEQEGGNFESSTYESVGAVGGNGSLLTDGGSVTDPYTSASSTFDRNLSDMAMDFF